MSADDDRAQLTQLQKDWMQAVSDRDMARLEEIVSPGFRFTAIHLNPEPMTREQWMAAAADDARSGRGARRELVPARRA